MYRCAQHEKHTNAVNPLGENSAAKPVANKPTVSMATNMMVFKAASKCDIAMRGDVPLAIPALFRTSLTSTSHSQVYSSSSQSQRRRESQSMAVYLYCNVFKHCDMVPTSNIHLLFCPRS